MLADRLVWTPMLLRLPQPRPALGAAGLGSPPALAPSHPANSAFFVDHHNKRPVTVKKGNPALS